MLAIIGSVLVLASVLGSFVMDGGKLLLLWHPSEFIIILGAAIGAFVTSNSMKVVKGGLRRRHRRCSRARATGARITWIC